MNHPIPPLPSRDLDEIVEQTAPLWEEARKQAFFITGGTGFFGSWLLSSWARCNDTLGLGMKATVLTRDADAFRRKSPHLAARSDLTLLQADVRSFELPKEQFRYVIHAATEASAKMIEENPAAMLDTIVSGTRCVLQLTKNCGCAKLLFTSSGAVYGPQPAEILNAPETYLGAPDPLLPGSAYGIGKRVAEHLCVLQARESGCEAKIARCFAFVGPMLPLDTHFAIGNFLRDALAGRDITVAGDGTPYRSYLYASDLATWLWTILFRGPPCRAYNVGSDQPISIRELALIIQRLVGANSAVQIARQPAPGATPSRYVPSTHRASAELGLKHTVPIEEAILRTTAWIKSSNLLHPSAII